ncbi:hypothetical protein GCM10027022_19410 [Alpinimonas psychrophila]|uniref:Uncharacterized membrane protein YhaH (DUF805 family) n=1 Tax=Alpinimonas psychrophila TaxID=748908 RepID=A0A7W3PPH0_9MICO|nr:DUF1524 domain-containing protein [Alpinimonas psychrophila]MBA8829487.1 uncharacterized membrane protein YhaH (DUF805 family) [Alpinimonas psychrophila]
MSMNDANPINVAYSVVSKKLVELYAFNGALSQGAFLKNLYFVLPAAFICLFLGAVPVLQTILILATLASLASSVLRRVTDTGISRWVTLILLIPFVGWVFGAILVALPTNAGAGKTLKDRLPKPLLTVVAAVTIFFALFAPMAAIAVGSSGKQVSTVASPEDTSRSVEPSSSPSATAKKTSSPTPTPTTAAASYASLLTLIPVADEATSGYDRALFVHWIDADKNSCDTREEVLIAESLTKVTVGAGCSISGGSWASAYDSVASTNASSFDIDHFVPLKEAWDSGADKWDAATRQAFANDLGYDGSLIAVSASSNRSKSDRDPSEWLPSEASYKCQYVYTWVQVKIRWSLTMDAKERAAIEKASSGCAESALGSTEQALVAVVQKEPEPVAPAPAVPVPAEPAPAAPAEPAPAAPSGTDPRFGTCKEANANGYGNYRSGVDEEYGWYRDRDKDGVDCEF